MEFDTKIKLRDLERFEIISEKSEEEIFKAIYDICKKNATDIGDAGNGKLWLDYSTVFKTRHITCNIQRSDANDADNNQNKYIITLSSGTKASRIGDALIVLFIITCFWCLSKLIVPHSPIQYIIGFAISLVALIACSIIFGKAFGREETEKLMYEIKKDNE